MEYNAGTPQDNRIRLRDWFDPTRLYNPNMPVGRFHFFWGLAIYPFAVLFVLLTASIMILEAVSPSANVGDNIGLVTYGFMLLWVTAAVCICLRRLRALGRSSAWVWLAVLPIVNLIFFLYLMLKPDPA